MQSQIAGDERIAYAALSLIASPFMRFRQLLCKHAWCSEGLLPGFDGKRVARKRCHHCKKAKAFTV